MLTELLREIRKRPGIRLPAATLTALEAYLNGLFEGIESASAGQLPTAETVELWNGFVSYVLESYSPLPRAAGWRRAITFHSFDDASALEDFFELYERYLRERETHDATPPQTPPPEGKV